MICKKCDAVIENGLCPVCHERPILINRSNELDLLMGQIDNSDSPKASELEQKPVYRGTISDEKKKGIINELKTITHYIPMRLSRTWALVLAVIVIFPAILSGIIGYNKGFSNGNKEGFISGTEKGFVEGEKQGYSEGHQKGLDEAQKSGDTVLYKEEKEEGASTGVIVIQKILNKIMAANLEEDGIYGNATVDAIKEFQKNTGLDPTGITDSETLIRIFYYCDHPEEYRKRHNSLSNEEQKENDSKEEVDTLQSTVSPEEPDMASGTVRPESVNEIDETIHQESYD